MRHFLCTLAALSLAFGTQAQLLPTNSFAVTSGCPGSNNNPSQLKRILQDGTATTIATILDENNNEVVLNALGYDLNDPTSLYGLNVNTSNPLASSNIYQIDVTSGAATTLGTVTPPPAAGFFDIGVTFSFIGDGAPGVLPGTASYFIAGVVFTANPFTMQVSNPRLYVGEIPFPVVAVGGNVAPIWRLANTSDPATTTVLNNFAAEVNTQLASPNPTLPRGGIQDWVYDVPTNTLRSYLGVERKFTVISNVRTTPVVVTTTPTTMMPGAANEIGAMFTDRDNRLYALNSDVGTVYEIDPLDGDYLGKSYVTTLGCFRGDAVSFRNALPLPVTLTSFSAQEEQGIVRLAWATASEKAASHFLVERQTAGTPWQAVAKIPTANSASGKRYSAQDTQPIAGDNYYRLVMVDLDGTTTYSQIQHVALSEKAGKALTLYPNPAAGAFTVVIPKPDAQSEIEIINQLGQIVWRQSTQAKAQVEIATKTLPAGLYQVRVKASGNTSSQKLVLR